ncbi:MAG: IS1595 family transposase [Sphingomicrobium sp.]|nr:IS1595 family transposase [Sphingomonadales bacterium]
MSVLSRPYFHDEEKAFEYLESVIWADGKVCPHCGGLDRLTKVRANPAKRIRFGLWRCGDCKRQFTVKVGMVFEHARVPLNKMLQAVYLLTSSKKGFSAHQLHRALEVTYKTAWFIAHRVREALRTGDLGPLGGEGGVVEIDETYIGKKPGVEVRRGWVHMMPVLALVHRESGKARSFVLDNCDRKEILPLVASNVDRETYVMTDDAVVYRRQLRPIFLGHGTVIHSKGEYGRGRVHTNTVEGYFSIFKRGMKGVYQHCSSKHLHRYVAEFEFRYNNREAHGVNDVERSVQALRGIVGRRLTYKSPDRQTR